MTDAMGDAAPIAETLGRFVAASRAEDIPQAVYHEAKRALLNFFATALGVAAHPAVDAAVKVLRDFAGPAQASLIGRGERLDMLSASFVNAMAANLLDYNDTHLATIIHPTAPVAPAVLALAEYRGLSGEAALHAFILGAEIECRLGKAVSPGHYARGWHITATCGVFGSAVASAKLLGLEPPGIGHALGIAASQSAGVVENLPTGAKNVGVGNAARNGLFAALMAEQHSTAAPRAIDGSLGWARAAGDAPRLGELTDALGERWEIATIAYKPYPCGVVMHAVIDACFALRRDHRVAAVDIANVLVRGDALLLARGDRAVTNEREAKVSIHHSVAAVFLYGAAGVTEFSESAVMSPEAVAFRAKVRAELASEMPVGSAEGVVETRGGEAFRATVLNARGSAALPMSDREIEAKLRDEARRGSPRCDVDRLAAAVWDLDRSRDIGELMSLARADR
ncbi:MAG TPA: MmgE/PrpD family protein [Stellaceae bacterium]|nr:MmgE/PrpD family protein [Stellaceae bacterium]